MSTTTESPAIPAGKFRTDPVHSTVGFEVKHMISAFRGNFGDYDARLDNSNGAAKLTGFAGVESVDVKDENLAAHLQSPDFFDSGRHPRVEFTSESIKVDDGAVTLEGELTIKGTTRPITAVGRLEHVEADLSGNERIGLQLETVVDRREFGLNWNAPLPKGGFMLANDVTLTVDLELVQG
jgi:polyisoprenoid-binding protein YceI